MRILSIGNSFESHTLMVDCFCRTDSEVVAKSVNNRISGAAIVVAAVAAFLGETVCVTIKNKTTNTLREFLELLEHRGIEILKLAASDNNIMVTIYDNSLSRQCYTYTPDGLDYSDLMSIDYSEYDIVFLCCLPCHTVRNLLICNASIQSTCTVVLPSGLSSTYFTDNRYQVNSDYLFMNFGELCNVLSIQNQNILGKHELISKVSMLDTNVIITYGKNGVFGVINDEYFEYDIEPIAGIVHPGGAGDSFATGFMVSLIQGHTIPESCMVGHQCAAKLLSVFNTEEFLRGTDEIIWE